MISFLNFFYPQPFGHQTVCFNLFIGVLLSAFFLSISFPTTFRRLHFVSGIYFLEVPLPILLIFSFFFQHSDRGFPKTFLAGLISLAHPFRWNSGPIQAFSFVELLKFAFFLASSEPLSDHPQACPFPHSLFFTRAFGFHHFDSGTFSRGSPLAFSMSLFRIIN